MYKPQNKEKTNVIVEANHCNSLDKYGNLIDSIMGIYLFII